MRALPIGMVVVALGCGSAADSASSTAASPDAGPTSDADTTPACKQSPGSFGTWTVRSRTGAPHAGPAVWTGTEAIVFADWSETYRAIAAYDPKLDTWRSIPITSSAPSPRSGMALAFVSGKVLMYGGGALVEAGISDLHDGALMDPATGGWVPISTAGAPDLVHGSVVPRTFERPSPVVGNKVVVLGGGYGTDAAAIYDAQADQWGTRIVKDDHARPGCDDAATDGAHIACGDISALDEMSADPLSKTSLPQPPNLPADVTQIEPAYVGGYLFAWMIPAGPGPNPQQAVAIFNEQSSAWNTAADAPFVRRGAVVEPLGGKVVVFGGQDADITHIDIWYGDGAAYDPASDSWRPITCDGAPVGMRTSISTIVNTGEEILLLDGYSFVSLKP